ncbi:MAG: hypothetical protein HN729_09915 [Candidatus Marinimicrobia bacterium]|jgi:hypothetical protein|nr:hypothetical protein [Candidatus Neomarinimicrobiota bacterium]MBT3683838.1 hypothetical protein [Candidatus Neomarinimicrobiota bacterium]MBT3760659.1 hypothetical protein [Candidatus Neomarinimicrobiota bacterium]MBT3896848.1 hypothetical protein [Candidatus Neomarinimicrobiota bacterium]MBT4173895.1 hypothetical protein [Candidatus Neomarinimicrobiota bacterium]
MMTNLLRPFLLLTVILFFTSACSENQTPKDSLTNIDEDFNSKNDSSLLSGYMDTGELLTHWDCLGGDVFAPIDIKSWQETPAVNRRLPSADDILQGRSILYYGEDNPDVKAYDITLPKLAYYTTNLPTTEFDWWWKTGYTNPKTDLVVVIQMVESAQDTIVGFRYLTGNVAGSTIGDFHFLTDDEVAEAVRQ